MAPTQPPGSGRRKRARPQDSSPAPAPSPSAVASTAKKRRLNGVADSPRSTPKEFSAIASAIGGMRGRSGLRKRNPVEEHDDTTAESSYDVPDSDAEESERPSIKPRSWITGSCRKKSRPRKGLYDVPDSGDELDPVGVTATEDEEENNPVTPSKRRSVKSDAKSTLKRSTARQRDAQAPKGSATNGSTTNSLGAVTPRKRGRPPKAKVDTAVVTTGFPLAVKARIYGTAKKGTCSVVLEPPKLKGILSPQKRKATRPVKTVVFDESEEVESDILDTDATPRPVLVPTTGKSRSQRTKEPPALLDKDLAKDDAENDQEEEEEGDDEEEEEEEEEDDEVCAICSKPDSEPPNVIVFCEVCDRGFHQKCYNVPVVPEGDWICRTCSQEDVLPERPDVMGKKVTASIEIPEIPNFERHLAKMRRVLLDRCSGNRRIKLRGQTEAYEKAYQLVEQTVLAGEGNSMMVIGGRGCGKTTVSLFPASLVLLLTYMTDDGRDSFRPSSRTCRRISCCPPQWIHSHG